MIYEAKGTVSAGDAVLAATVREPGVTASKTFLDGLSDDDRAELERLWITCKYERDETIITHDGSDRDVFFVLEGRARATIYSDSGRMVAYRDIEPGGIFGELAAIDGKARSASVVALDSMRVAHLSASSFRNLVETRPGFTWAILVHLSDQMRRMTERVYEFSTLVVRKRLIRELLRLAGGEERAEGSATIFPAPTHFDLATMISTHREAVSREMSELSRRKLVERRGKKLLLPDPAALEALAGTEN